MRAFWQFVSIITIGLILITVYSFVNYELKLGDVSLKKAGIKKYLFFSDSIESPEVQNFAFLEKDEPSDSIVVDTTAQHVLLIGDSMLEGLMLRFRDYAEYNGHTMKTVIWYSSQSMWYGSCDTLAHFIRKEKPTFVILSIGSNELFIKDIKNARRKYVKRIVAQMDTIPFIWVGPPNWKDDTGINDLIVEHVGLGRYFESKKLTYKRGRDGAHPTRESAVVWMDSIAAWMRTDCSYRINMEVPPTRSKISANTTLLQPLK